MTRSFAASLRLLLAAVLGIGLCGCELVLAPSDGDGDDVVTLPETFILAGSRTGTYAVVNPTTGEDIVEISPDTHSLGLRTLGFGGQRVYFLSTPGPLNGTLNIYGCDALTGENLVKLTAFEGMGASILDGSLVEAKLVFAAYTNETPQTSHIYTINEDGTGQTQLTDSDDPLTLLDGTAVLSLGEGMPAWSPDGSRILYVARVGEVGSIGMQYEAVVVMDADGSDKEIVYDRSGTAHYRNVVWSHNCRFIILGDVGDGENKIRAVAVNSTAVSDLTDALKTEATLENMAASPDRFAIVFNYRIPGGGSLYTAELSATGDTVTVSAGPTQLTDALAAGHGYSTPDWASYIPEE